MFKLSQESGAAAPDSVELLDGGCQRQPVGPVCRNARTCSDCSFISLLLCASSFCTSVVALQCLHACMQVQVHACIQEHTHTPHAHIASGLGGVLWFCGEGAFQGMTPRVWYWDFRFVWANHCSANRGNFRKRIRH